MNAEQVSEVLNISVDSLKKNFKQTVLSAQKKGIILEKEGRGKNVKYTLTPIRAETLFKEEEKEVNLHKESLELNNWELSVLLAVLLTPMKVFRGTEKQLLEYLDNSVQASNKVKAKEAVNSLVEKDFLINFTDEDIIYVGIKRKIEKEIELNSAMVSKSKTLAKKNSIRDWQNVFKVWLSIKILCTTFDTKITAEEIVRMTDLNTKMVNKCIKALENNNYINTKKIFAKVEFEDSNKTFMRCSGRIVNEFAFEY